jgi:hypothetical protein
LAADGASNADVILLNCVLGGESTLAHGRFALADYWSAVMNEYERAGGAGDYVCRCAERALQAAPDDYASKVGRSGALNAAPKLQSSLWCILYMKYANSADYIRALQCICANEHDQLAQRNCLRYRQ